MSGKYVDDEGLEEVWKKIKDRSIRIIPISKEEYDLLSDAEKKKQVIYAVDS